MNGLWNFGLKILKKKRVESMKVRFHLGGGEHHRKFQVIDDEGVKTYYDPEQVQLRI